MVKENGQPEIPSIRPIYRLIGRTRRLLRSTWVATGAGLTVGLLLGALVAITMIDLTVALWPSLRLIGLLLIAVPAAWAFMRGVVRPLFRRLGTQQIARKIEDHIPGIHNRLVSCIELAEKNVEEKQSIAFYRRLVREALDKIRGFRAGRVVDFLSLRRASLFAFGSTFAFVFAWSMLSDRMPTAMARILSPFADIPPASGVEYTVEPGNAKVLRDEDIVFSARVTRGIPDQLRLELTNEKGDRPLWYDLKKDGPDLWKISLSGKLAPGFEDSFAYRIHGGGTWSKKFQIVMIDRPTVVSHHTVLHYPTYMGITEPKVGPPQTLEVTGPEDSRVEVVAEADGNVAEGEIQMLDFGQPREEVKDRMERVWFEEKLPAGAVPEGVWRWDRETHGKATHTEPAAVGPHGHWFQKASETFTVQSDEKLFANIYLIPDKKPLTVMLEWHDGKDWEHRAFWGEDKILWGKAGTAGRFFAGPLPAAGQWVRLEVPANLVDLQGKALKGMGFKVFNGQAFWNRAGTLPPILTVVDRMPMHALEDRLWSGQFPLRGTGLYRVELRNELGYANKPMKEARYIALPDNPPQIVLERPGGDLVLSEPAKVPLVLAAFDDYGLSEMVLMVQRGEKGPWEERLLKHYDKPARSDHVVTNLDLPAMSLHAGEFVRYRAEVRDRKGQSATTPSFIIRLAADPNAADKQLAAFEQSQDPFQEKLAKLIAEQAKVREAVEKSSATFAPLEEKIKAAQAKVQPAPAGSNTSPPELKKDIPVQLDPEGEKMLQALRQELAKMAAQENQNAHLGQQIAGDLTKTIEQAANLKLLPQEMTAELRALQQTLQEKAIQPLQDLGAEMNRGAQPFSRTPDMNDLKHQAERLQKDLEAMRAQAQALARAKKEMHGNADKALADLRKDLERERGRMTAAELEELRDFINKLREDIKNAERKQEHLADDEKKASDSELSEVAKHQAELEKESDPLLEKTKLLQAAEKMRRMKRKPTFPEAPYTPEEESKFVRPREEDPDEPEAGKKEKGEKNHTKEGTKPKTESKDKDEETDPLYMPALGGPKPKLDPRYANRRRPVPPKVGTKKKGDSREELENRQEQNLQDLDMAQQSLGSDKESLEQMLEKLARAAKPIRSSESKNKEQGQEGQESEAMKQLRDLLESPEMRQARAMASQLQQMRQGKAGKPGHRPGTPAAAPPVGNQEAGIPPGSLLEGELGKLDLATRTVILKMQPKLREEILQSMRDEGPEGYRKFIQNYFKRLTEVKTAP